MFSSLLLVASIFLIFIMPPAGIALFIVSYFMITREARDESREQDKLSVKEYYESIKWQRPLDKTTINTLKKIDKLWKTKDSEQKHFEWLQRQVDQFESEYKYEYADISRPKSKFEDINFLFNSPDKYKAICKFIDKKPIFELIEDWKVNDLRYENQLNIESQERRLYVNKVVLEAKSLVIELHQDGLSREEIIKKVKKSINLANENSIAIYRENNIWHIAYGGRSEKFKL